MDYSYNVYDGRVDQRRWGSRSAPRKEGSAPQLPRTVKGTRNVAQILISNLQFATIGRWVTQPDSGTNDGERGRFWGKRL